VSYQGDSRPCVGGGGFPPISERKNVATFHLQEVFVLFKKEQKELKINIKRLLAKFGEFFQQKLEVLLLS